MANVVVGVTGGIAAYKSAAIIRLFAEAGYSIQVVATQNAFKFIGKTTLEALSGNPVSVIDPDLFTEVDQVKHIAISKSADLVVVAPATASFIAKLAAGIADDLLTTTVLAATCPIVLAPAMHTEMWENQATQSNLDTLGTRGIHIVWPEVGRLTGEDSGIGRLADPQLIFESAVACLGVALRGKRVLVTAGGTREPIDAARFIGNYSSGKQGIAFARAAKQMGAEVELIAANVDQAMTRGLECTNVQTALQLSEEIAARQGNYDILVMAAAVADFRPAAPTDEKLKRSEVGEKMVLELVANPDLLAKTITSLDQQRSKVLVIGFAAEASSELEALARKKLVSKGCDYIVANDISRGAVFGDDVTDVVLVSENATAKFSGTKQVVANEILSLVADNMRTV